MSSHPNPPKNNYVFHPNNAAFLLKQEEIQVWKSAHKYTSL